MLFKRIRCPHAADRFIACREISDDIIAKESYGMNVFDMICIGVLVLYVGGYIWIHASRKLAPPEE